MGAALTWAPPLLARRGSKTMIAAVNFLVIGAGGLGCPALLGLLAGGARRITIVDDDRVEPSNLPRQVLYASADHGAAKVEAARAALLGRSPEGAAPAIQAIRQRLEPETIGAFLDARRGTDGADAAAPWVVLECSDSPALKFAVHDACFARAIPCVIGGVVRWHGQAMAIDPSRDATACYRCLFEAPPPRELAPACASVGVAGPVAGALGHAIATLAVGLAAARSDAGARDEGSPPPPASPAGVCLHLDLLGASVRRLAPRPRPGCPTCGPTRGPL